MYGDEEVAVVEVIPAVQRHWWADRADKLFFPAAAADKNAEVVMWVREMALEKDCAGEDTAVAWVTETEVAGTLVDVVLAVSGIVIDFADEKAVAGAVPVRSYSSVAWVMAISTCNRRLASDCMVTDWAHAQGSLKCQRCSDHRVCHRWQCPACSRQLHYQHVQEHRRQHYSYVCCCHWCC